MQLLKLFCWGLTAVAWLLVAVVCVSIDGERLKHDIRCKQVAVGDRVPAECRQ